MEKMGNVSKVAIYVVTRILVLLREIFILVLVSRILILGQELKTIVATTVRSLFLGARHALDPWGIIDKLTHFGARPKYIVLYMDFCFH